MSNTYDTSAAFPLPRQPSPEEKAAFALSRKYRNVGPGNNQLEVLADALIPKEPWEYGLMAALPGAGVVGRGLAKLPQAAKAALLAAGFGTTASEAQAGKSETAKKALETVGAVLGLYPTTTAGRILKETKGGGYSVNLPSGIVPTEGLMMGRYKNTDPRNMVLTPDQLNRANIERQAATNAKVLAQPGMHFGSWKDPETGQIYFDVSQRFEPDQIRQATKFGERTGQKAGYNKGTGKDFPVGSWRGFVAGPEFKGRVNEMAGIGREYLERFPTKEWWDMHGTRFEDVYGTPNLPQVAGYSATTAPVTSPRQNMQIMSEYMRRFLSGEPTIQPDWRVPEGSMRTAGKQMPMETGRAANLEKSTRGALDELQEAKVRSEAQAMSGDPNAMVFDRHWARLPEDPARGIYTATQEGVIEGGVRKRGLNDYDYMGQYVAAPARELGRTPRDHSADAWTGIRETIKNTNQLYGVPYKGSSITGESMSYADHLSQLIKDKAAHMGITEKELDKRLSRGEADLLSGLLASSPVLYGVYQQWQQAQQRAGGS